jgi:hypothetical protein
VACVRNFWAFTVFGFAWMAVFALTGLAVALATGLLMGVLGAGFAAGSMMAAAMLLAAMFFTSVVFTFRDCFEPPDSAGASPQG